MLTRLSKRLLKSAQKATLEHPQFLINTTRRNFSTTENQSVKDIDMQEALKIDPDLLEEKVPDAEERDKVFTEKKMSTLDHVKVVLHHIKKGFVGVYTDGSYLAGIIAKNQLREKSYTIYELRERRRISKDLFKFIPYSIFMTIPFLEAFLPVYMLLFPNSAPTQFLFDNQVGEKTKELVEKQRDSYAKIIPLLPKFANVIGLDPLKFVQSISDIIEREGKDKDRMYYRVSDFESKIGGFVKQYKNTDKRCLSNIRLRSMTAYELEQTAKLLCLEYIPGYNILNKCLWTFTRLPFASYNFIRKKLKMEPIPFNQSEFYQFEFSFDEGPMKHLKKQLLIQQIQFHMDHIKAQDRQLARDLEQLETLNASDLSSIARQRGIKLDNSEDIKQYLVRYWLPLSVDYDLDVDVLVWVSFMRYSYVDVLV